MNAVRPFSGWLEVPYYEDDHDSANNLWIAALNIQTFVSYGDYISNVLFGLGKSPSTTGPFYDKPLPSIGSDVVMREIAEHDDAIRAYPGEPIFQTSCMFDQALAECQRLEREDPVFAETLPESGWTQIFEIGERLVTPHHGHRRKARFVLFGYW